jgi:nitronate monooxygenase
VKALNAVKISGREVPPLIEGGKGISVSTGVSSGAWAAAGGVGTFSGVNADFTDNQGQIISQIYHGRTRRERQEELIAFAVRGGIQQAQIAHETSNGQGRIHMNVLWEMGGAERVLNGILEGAKGLVHGITCGAGMPYKVADIAARFQVYYYPIVSSSRAFKALWKRAYHRVPELLGGVVYEDPWLAGGHNGLSNSEDPEVPQDPYPRVAELRRTLNEVGLETVPVIMAGGVWRLDEWSKWLDNPEIGPVAFQFGTRPLLTQESPIPEAWKKRLTQIKPGDVLLHRFSPTGFYSSAVKNDFLKELVERSDRQLVYTMDVIGEHSEAFAVGARGRQVYLIPSDKARAEAWLAKGFTEILRTPDSTIVFVAPDKAEQIRAHQNECMGCLSACLFSNWSQHDEGGTGRRPDPRSFCIQKTLQAIAHGDDVDHELMFAGHNVHRFGSDPFYANGFVPTVKQLVDRLKSGQ